MPHAPNAPNAPHPHKELLDEVRAVYAELERRPIERNCELRTECCHFRLTGRTPSVTRGEALLLHAAMRAAGRARIPESPDGACPLLDARTGRCTAYAGRPFGCRTHFCKAAGGPYARAEVADLIHRLEKIDVALGGNGGQSLPVALREASKAL